MAEIVKFPTKPPKAIEKIVHRCCVGACPMPAHNEIKLISVDTNRSAGSKWFCDDHAALSATERET